MSLNVELDETHISTCHRIASPRTQKSGCRTVSNNGSGSGLVPAQNILAVQVWFGFT